MIFCYNSFISGVAPGKANFQLQPIKMENNNYRDPVQPYSHPSPPYETSYDTYHSQRSLYQPNYPTSQSQPGFSQSTTSQASSMNTLAQQNSIINQSAAGYGVPIANHSSPQHQTVAYDMSTGNQMTVEQSANQKLMNGEGGPFQSPPRTQHQAMNGEGGPYHSPPRTQHQAFTQSSGPIHYGEITPHRPNFCDMVVQQSRPQQPQQQIQPDPMNPYSQVSKRALFEGMVVSGSRAVMGSDKTADCLCTLPL